MTNSLKMYQNTNRSSAKKMVRIAGHVLTPDLIADSKQAAAVAADYIDNPVMEFGA